MVLYIIHNLRTVFPPCTKFGHKAISFYKNYTIVRQNNMKDIATRGLLLVRTHVPSKPIN